MAAEVTPRSAARAKSGRTITSGRTRLSVEVTAPMPGMLRRSFSTSLACSASTRPSSPASTSRNFSDEPPKPTFTRAPGSSARASRNCASTACFLTPWRSPRGVMLIVRVATRTSDAPPTMNGSAPVLPPPMAVYTSFTCGFFCTITRACSAAAYVCCSVLPGGSVTVTWVCDRSSGGMKPVGSSPTSTNDAAVNAITASVTFTRCFSAHAAQRMYTASQPGSLCSFLSGLTT